MAVSGGQTNRSPGINRVSHLTNTLVSSIRIEVLLAAIEPYGSPAVK